MIHLDSLALEKRIASYRALSEEARREANSATDPAIRATHLSLADGWLRLAAEAESKRQTAEA